MALVVADAKEAVDERRTTNDAMDLCMIFIVNIMGSRGASLVYLCLFFSPFDVLFSHLLLSVAVLQQQLLMKSCLISSLF
jgi:hypothetical protein